MSDRKYSKLDDWLFEAKDDSPRIEHLYNDLGPFDDIKDYSRLLAWINAAFEAGKHGN